MGEWASIGLPKDRSFTTISISGGTTLAGAATFSSLLHVAGAATLASTLHVTGAQTFTGASTFGAAVHVIGAATLASTLHVTGAQTFSGASTFGSTVHHVGAVTFAGNVVFAKTTGSLTLGVAATVNGFASVLSVTLTALGTTASTLTTITNSAVATTSIVLVTIEDFSGTFVTNGIPVASVEDIAAGNYKLRVTNLSAANAFTADQILQVGVVVL